MCPQSCARVDFAAKTFQTSRLSGWEMGVVEQGLTAALALTRFRRAKATLQSQSVSNFVGIPSTQGRQRGAVAPNGRHLSSPY